MSTMPEGTGTRGELAHSREIEPTEHWPALLDEIEGLGRVVVAYSGGVDSTLLAKVAHDLLGENALAVLAVSPSLAADERAEAPRLAELIGIRYLEIETGEADDPRYSANSGDRCYWCKSHLFEGLEDLRRAAPELAPDSIFTYGATADDLGDHRPGMRAAAEAGVAAPLVDAGLGKDEIREASRRLGLPTWDKPALACLASRVAYGTTVTPQRLARVDSAERAVRKLGFRQVRVRDLGERARVEVDPAELSKALGLEEEIVRVVRHSGFTRVLLDPEGYRSGKLNDALESAPEGKDPTT